MDPSRDPIALRYFVAIPNVGDTISPALVSGICQRETIWVPSGDTPHLLATGSILSMATPTSLVWGSGVMHPDIGVGSPRPENIYALRGRLSRDALARHAGNIPDVPLGDPAWLAAGLLGIRRSDSPPFRLGVVAHYVDRCHPHIQSLLRQDGVIDLDVHEEPTTFLRMMSCCGAVASTSLHGLIFAESLGIPNTWMKVSDEIIGGSFKFDDWFSVCGQPQRHPLELGSGQSVASLIAEAALHECTIDTRALTNSFPHSVIQDCRRPLGTAILPVDRCRGHSLPVFVVWRDEGPSLSSTLRAVRRGLPDADVVVLDCGQGNGVSAAIRDSLEAEGCTFIGRTPSSPTDWIECVNRGITEYFRHWGEPCAYGLVDCDALLGSLDTSAVQAARTLINRFRRARCSSPVAQAPHVPSAPQPAATSVGVPTPAGPVICWESSGSARFSIHRAGEAFALGKPCIDFCRYNQSP